MTGKPWKLPVISWIDAHIKVRRILWVASIVGIAAATIATTDGVESSIKEAQDKCETLHEAVGESDSVLVWQFDNTWVYGELGLDYYYPIPARYNASQDYWDSTAGADLEAGHWEYVIVAAAADVDVDDNVLLNDKGYHVIALSHGMAVAEGGGSGEDLYHNPPYQLP